MQEICALLLSLPVPTGKCCMCMWKGIKTLFINKHHFVDPVIN